MSNSEIITSAGGTTFAGPDAVALFRAMALKSGLKLYARTGMRPNRAWTPTAMLRTAAAITHKTYKRGEFEKAADDLHIWIETMKSALPVEER